MLPKLVDLNIIINELRKKYGEIAHFFYQNTSTAYELPFCTQVTIYIRGEEISSWGVGDTKDEATFKAVMELLERSIFLDQWNLYFKNMGLFKKEYSIQGLCLKYPRANSWLGNTTSGWAIHSNRKKAIESAKNELIERHTVLNAYLNKVKSKWMSIEDAVNSIWNNFSYKLPDNFKIDFYLLEGPLGHQVSVCRLNTPIGPFYGFGCSMKLIHSLKKSFYEVTPKIIYAYEQMHKDTPHYSRFFEVKCPFIELTLNEREESIYRGQSVRNNEIYFNCKRIDTYFSEIKNLYIAQVISPLLQPLFKGEWSNEIINKLAFSTDDSSSFELPVAEHILN